MKLFISGPVTGVKNYKRKFRRIERKMTAKGYQVLNPAILPSWMKHEDAMHICYGMIDVADAVLFTDGWLYSTGCRLEHDYSTAARKNILYGEPK